MSLISWLPDVVFHLIFLAGVVTLIVGYFLATIPFVGRNLRQFQVIGIVVTVVGVWFEGGLARDSYYQEKIAELQTKIAVAERESETLNTAITEGVLMKQGVAREEVAVARGRIDRGSRVMNNQCKISEDVISILNNSARPGVSK